MANQQALAPLFDAANPLINPPETPHGAPPFDQLKDEHYDPAIRWAISIANKEIAAIRDNRETPNFENTIQAFAYSGLDLERISLIFENISDANANPYFDEIKKKIHAEKSRHESGLHADEKLFSRVRSVYDRRAQFNLTEVQTALLEKIHKGFILNGVHLDADQKKRLKVIDEELVGLRLQFGDNVTNARRAYKCLVTNEAELAGVPERAKNNFREMARVEGHPEGVFLLGINPPPADILTFCENRSLREELYKAEATICDGGAFDNTGNIMKIVRLRHEKACLLGYDTFADLVLSDYMAGDVKTVQDFLENNLAIYKLAAEAELESIKKFAVERDGLSDFKSWDLLYYKRLLMEQRYDFSAEELRPYFDLEKVLEGLRQHAAQLFGIEFRQEKTGKYPVYHPDVKVFEVFDNKSGDQIGLFYGDYYARSGCKGGARAWMNVFRNRGVCHGKDLMPIVINFGNFDRPTPEQPALLSAREIEIVFHEFGHGLAALLNDEPYSILNGFNVKWDYVELPSFLMEKWATEPTVLAGFAHHFESGKSIPDGLIRKLKDSQNFDAGLEGLDMTFRALLDMAYHSVDPSTISSPEVVEKQVSARATLMDRGYGLFSTGFTHIFYNRYAASYYSYDWGEVMAADIFAAFQKQGLYDPILGNRLRQTIYAKAGAGAPMDIYEKMMDRKPVADARFASMGLLPAQRSATGAVSSSQPLVGNDSVR